MSMEVVRRREPMGDDGIDFEIDCEINYNA
jgi:hypothetical protein